jgi:hypothetical protein
MNVEDYNKHNIDGMVEYQPDLTNIYTRLALTPFDPIVNFEIARNYYNAGQTASAISHYLRCAETTPYDELAYICLLQMSRCFALQKNRNFTVKHLIKHAITVLPKRPEAYYYLCKHYEGVDDHYECYTTACIALNVCDFETQTLETLQDYPGKYGLIFLQAKSGWHWDKNNETRKLLALLLNEYYDVMNNEHLTVVRNNLINLNVRLFAEC